MKTPLKLLVIEDRSADFRPLERQLVQHGLEAECHLVASGPDLDAALGNAWDVALFNHSEPDMDYRHILAKIHARWPSLPVLFIFGNLAEEIAVEMLQLGVWDFIPKDHLARLVPAIRRALHEVDQQHALKATEQALRKSEHRLRLVQEAAHVAICDWNVQTGGLDWTEEMESIYGYAPGTFLGNYEAFRDRVHPDDLADVERQLDEAVAAHLSFDFEFRLLLPSGTVRWVNYIGAANYDEHGVPSHIHGIQMDITDRKQAELALAEREIQYQAVIETAADGFWMLDEQGCILAINDAYARRSGYSREELLTMKITDLEALESPEEVRAHIEHVQRDGSDLFETLHRTKDGEVWPAEVKASYWAAAGGRFFGFLRDITERKRTEAALQESEARFRATFEQAAVGIAHVAPDGRWLRMNRRLCEIVGYSQEELLVRTFQDITLAADLGTDLEYVRRMLADEIPIYSMEKRYLRKDGGLVWINLTVALVRRGDGRPDYFISVIEDIQRRKEAELALAERETQYRAVIETTADGFWMLDEQGRILAVNDAYVRRSGYSREELLSMRISELDANESPEEIHAHIEQIRRDGSDLFETRHRTKDGEVWPAEVNASYWATAGDRFFGFMRDITERKRTEAELRALHTEMEQLMRFHVAGQTVAAITHELNQPLNAVTSYTEAALRLLRAGNPQPDKLKHALESSAQQAQRAGRVARNLLAFMKQGDVQTEPVDINKIVRGAMSRIEANIYGAFQVRLELEPYLAKVRANRLQVEKVLVNLIENGIEAMRDAGVNPLAITITVRACTDGSMAQVTVCDRGPGVDAQTLHRIFDPFFTTKPKGLGMGLSISLAIIEAHGGRLWVDSESASGSSFHFTLPFAA